MSVDEVHARAVSRGFKVVYPLTNEPWGVRPFFVTDPNGTIINVMCHMGEANHIRPFLRALWRRRPPSEQERVSRAVFAYSRVVNNFTPAQEVRVTVR